jgi:hypothetical protein
MARVDSGITDIAGMKGKKVILQTLVLERVFLLKLC